MSTTGQRSARAPQLLKMVASGHLIPAEFQTAHEARDRLRRRQVPIDVTGDAAPDAETEEPAQGTAAPTAPAAVADTPTAPEAGDGQNGEDDDEQGDGGGGDDDDDAEEAAAAGGPLPWEEAEAEAEAEEVEEQPPAKKQKGFVDGNMMAFVTKHAPSAAKIAAPRKTGAHTPRKTIAEQPARQVGRGASTHKNGARVNDV